MTEQRHHTLPVPLTLEQLRDHFRTTYKLTEPQIEIMVVSSAKSLYEGMARLRILVARDTIDPEQAKTVLHGMKGVLLNMGADRWAGFAKEIEDQLTTGPRVDFARVVSEMDAGLREILVYTGDGGTARD